MNFSEFVLESLVKKFVMRKAATNRFVHLLSSCMKYKFIQRVKLFGRFIGVYDKLSHEDFQAYLDFLNLTYDPNSKQNLNLDHSDRHFLPYPRALDFMR